LARDKYDVSLFHRTFAAQKPETTDRRRKAMKPAVPEIRMARVE
jgi:hypothetical protein